MRWLVMLLSLGAAVVLEQALPAWQLGGQTRPPVLLCVVMYYALNYSHIVALAIALLAGVLADAIAGLPLGSASLTFALLAVAVNRIEFRVYPQWLTHMVRRRHHINLYYVYSAVIAPRTNAHHYACHGNTMAGMAGACYALDFMAMEAFEKMTGCRRSLRE